jgi:hypothetical protein
MRSESSKVHPLFSCVSSLPSTITQCSRTCMPCSPECAAVGDTGKIGGAGTGTTDHSHDDHGHAHGDNDPAEGETSRYSIQTCFDLLGELCKFNPEAVALVEQLPFFPHESCGDSAGTAAAPVTSACSGSVVEDLLKAACGRLIDSNVFLRSLVLTFDAFRNTEFAGLLERSQVCDDTRCSTT